MRESTHDFSQFIAMLPILSPKRGVSLTGYSVFCACRSDGKAEVRAITIELGRIEPNSSKDYESSGLLIGTVGFQDHGAAMTSLG